jgi:hypothetical protein
VGRAVVGGTDRPAGIATQPTDRSGNIVARQASATVGAGGGKALALSEGMPTLLPRLTLHRHALAFALLTSVLGVGQSLAAQARVTSGGPHAGGLDEPETFNVVWGYGVDWTPCAGGQNIVWSNSVWNDDADGQQLALVWGVEQSERDDDPCGATDSGVELGDPGRGETPGSLDWRPVGAADDGRVR